MTSTSAKVAKQLKQFGRAIDAPQQQDLDQRADGGDDQGRCNNAAPEAQAPPILVAKV